VSKVESTVHQIRQLIQANSQEDGRLPSEPDLARMLDASRATIRLALSELESDGLIVRKHGSGTFINQQVLGIRTRLEEVWDFQEMIRLAGYTPGVRHHEQNLVRASQKLTDALCLEPDEEVLSTANVFMANDMPVIYCVDVIPAHLVRHAYREAELQGPVYTFLAERCGQHIDHNITEILPVVAKDSLAEFLECEPGSALHYFEEIGFNADHEPILYSEEYYRPEFFSFKVIRKMTTRRQSEADEHPKT
jgi:GntR family transcriptional regulator